MQSRFFKALAVSSALCAVSTAVYAHTNSIGYENSGPGSVTFWYGSWHPGTNFTEGSLQVTGPSSYNITQAFTQVVQVKPTGLIDGTTNFFSDGTQLVGTPDPSGTYAWQGATLTGLAPGTYTFTYIPIAMPTATWQPADSIILSNSVYLSAALVGGAFEPNSTGTSQGAAQVLDDITNTATGDMANVITELQNMGASEQQEALQRIAPETSQAVSSASTQAISGALDSVSSRLDSIRSQGYMSAMADRLMRGDEIQVAAAGDLSGVLGAPPLRHSFWSKAFGAYADQGYDDGFAGYDAKTAGMAFGADTLLDSDWVVGAAATYAYTGVAMDDFRSGDKAKINSYQLTGYGSRDFGTWYVEGMLAAAYQQFDTKRETVVSGMAEGDFDGRQYAGRLTAGMPLPIEGKLTFTPSIGMEINYFTQDSYTETGAGPLNLAIDDVSATRVRSVVQAKLSTEKRHGNYKIVPAVHVGWRHEFKNDGIASTSTFTGGGAAFATPGQDTQRNTFNLGGKLSISETQDFTLSVQLDTERAEDYQAYAGQLLGQWRF